MVILLKLKETKHINHFQVNGKIQQPPVILWYTEKKRTETKQNVLTSRTEKEAKEITFIQEYKFTHWSVFQWPYLSINTGLAYASIPAVLLKAANVYLLKNCSQISVLLRSQYMENIKSIMLLSVSTKKNGCFREARGHCHFNSKTLCSLLIWIVCENLLG